MPVFCVLCVLARTQNSVFEHSVAAVREGYLVMMPVAHRPHVWTRSTTQRLRVGFVQLLIAGYTLLHASLQLCAGCERAMIGRRSVANGY